MDLLLFGVWARILISELTPSGMLTVIDEDVPVATWTGVTEHVFVVVFHVPSHRSKITSAGDKFLFLIKS